MQFHNIRTNEGALFAPISLEYGLEHFHLPKNYRTSDMIDVYLPKWHKRKWYSCMQMVQGVHEKTGKATSVFWFRVMEAKSMYNRIGADAFLWIAICVFSGSGKMAGNTIWDMYQVVEDQEDLTSTIVYCIVTQPVYSPVIGFPSDGGVRLYYYQSQNDLQTVLHKLMISQNQPMDRLKQLLFERIIAFLNTDRNLFSLEMNADGCYLLMQTLVFHRIRNPSPKITLLTRCLLSMALEVTLTYQSGSTAFKTTYACLTEKLPTILSKKLTEMVSVLGG